MRLAQLARKISVKASEIIEFLASNHIQIENSSNAKVIDEHVELVLNHFAPEMIAEDESSEPDESSAQETRKAEIDIQDISQKVEEIVTKDDVLTPDEIIEIPELIKPAKVELPGLKVVGKIDLPDPKKKDDETTEDNIAAEGETLEDSKTDNSNAKASRSESRKTSRPRREFDRRPRKNPIALKREREESEALKRKLEQKEKEKELRTQRYLKKVSTKVAPPKPIKRIKNDEEYEVYTEESTKPRSFFGRILNWFVTE